MPRLERLRLSDSPRRPFSDSRENEQSANDKNIPACSRGPRLSTPNPLQLHQSNAKRTQITVSVRAPSSALPHWTTNTLLAQSSKQGTRLQDHQLVGLFNSIPIRTRATRSPRTESHPNVTAPPRRFDSAVHEPRISSPESWVLPPKHAICGVTTQVPELIQSTLRMANLR